MAMSMVGASRSRTNVFLRFRDTLRTHKRGPRTNTELKEFKVHKNLLAAQSDDEGSTVDARVYSVPPVWVTLVDDMNRDISQIKIKSAPTRITRTHCDSIFFFVHRDIQAASAAATSSDERRASAPACLCHAQSPSCRRCRARSCCPALPTMTTTRT